MLPKLRSLQLWLSTLPELEELQLDSVIQGVQELVLHVHSCPKLPRKTKQALHDSVHSWHWFSTDTWVSIEEVQAAWFPAFGRGKKPFPADPKPKPKLAVEGASASCHDLTDLPFPCGHPNCTKFHDNIHGFCQKHRFNRLWRKIHSAANHAFHWMELIVLLTIQAAAEIQSRILLLLIFLSLVPVTCIFLEQSTGASAAYICSTVLVVAVGSCLYTAKRLDGMQQRVFNVALATEANYFQVLQPADATAVSEHLVQVSPLLRNQAVRSQEVLQAEEDLRSKYLRAKNHAGLFQTAVLDPLSNLGLEVFAKIKSPADLDDRDGGVEILSCEVFCEGLQQVQQTWEMLKGLDIEIILAQDFFAMTSSKKCLRIVVAIRGCLATVFLLEKSLSILEAPKGIEDAANSLGLLDKTTAGTWEVSRSPVGEVPRWALVTIWILRLLSCSGSIVMAIFIHGLNEPFWSAWNCSMALPFWACFAILFWEMWEMLSVALAGGRRRPRIRLRPTQMWYRKYLGVQGRHYALKVVALQLMTVLLQGFAKANLFGAIREANGPEALKSSAAVQCFFVLILSNIFFPALVFAIPNCVSSRVIAAAMDAFLDVGYMVTSLWLYIGFATQQSLNAFLGNFWNYMSLYFCISHVVCVCRSLESADWTALFQVSHAAPMWGPWRRMLFSLTYAATLVAFVGVMPGGPVFDMADMEWNDGLCPGCECSTLASGSVLLEHCLIGGGYFAQASPTILAFDLTNRNISEVLADAFRASAPHQRVRSLSLRGNHLTELPEGLFCDLLDQKMDMDIVDVGYNRVTALSPNIFQPRSSQAVRIQELHLEANALTTLPAGVFRGLEVHKLHLQDNDLTRLYANSFQGLRFFRDQYFTWTRDGLGWGGHDELDYELCDDCILDISRNKLETLPPKVFEGLEVAQLYLLDISGNKLQVLAPKVFEGLEVRQLHLQDNDLIQLHASSFQGLRFLRPRNRYGIVGYVHCDDCILDISRNKLETLPPKVFEGLEVVRLHLQENALTTLPAEVFRGLKFGGNNVNAVLDISRNKLQTLPPKVFEGLKVAQLHLQENALTTLPAEVFRGLAFGGNNAVLDISWNKLQILPEDVWARRPQLHVLNLAHNELSELPSGYVFKYSNCKLQHLKLDSNRLWTLNSDSFCELGRLQELNLEKNQLTELPANVFACRTGYYYYYEYHLRNLLQLKLGGNRLAALRDGLFNHLTKLRNLQLQSNQLTRLPQKIFQNLAHLESLNLSQNQLDELPPGLFDGLNLAVIDLSHNNLTMLDAKLFNLENLTTLDLRGNFLADTTRQDLARLKVELFVD